MSESDRSEVLQFKLDQLRKRLLNLSTRNKLLSTKFSDRSRQHFRIIDELPDVLFSKLHESLRFRSLPKIEDDPADERTEKFVEALHIARLTDPQFLKGQQTLEQESVDNDDPRWDDVERALKDKVRDDLGMVKRSRLRVSVVEQARKHGLNPSYDLPKASLSEDDEPEKWTDNEIQLLMVPGTMEAKIDAVRDKGRSYEQERGVNILGVAFGFLEWRESDSSSKSHYAPLILQGARISRVARKSGYVYSIQSEQESPTDNETLRVRLRQDFGLELPVLEEDEMPEAYWSRLEKILDGRSGWRIRRWVAVGLFPFENIVITAEIEKHLDKFLEEPLVGRVLAVGDVEGRAGEVAESGDVPLEERSEEDPDLLTSAAIGDHLPLIADADSSQEAVVRRVLSGEDIALKGPPGTGKSQTIMNIIGAVLQAGKTVLFVAEKKAALEVVANRLHSAGLGEMCLELHSDGTRPRSFLDSIGQSLFLDPPLRPMGLPSKISEHRKRREELERYARRLGAPYGITGHTVQEIFWLAREAIDQVSLSTELRDFKIAGPERHNVDTVERCRLCLEQLSQLHREVFGERGFDLTTHPWRGVSNESLTALDLDDIRAALGEWDLQLEALDKSIVDSNLAQLNVQDDSLKSLEDVLAAAKDAVTFVQNADSDLLGKLRDVSTQAELRAVLSSLRSLQETRAGISARVDAVKNPSESLRELSRGLRGAELPEEKLSELPMTLQRSEVCYGKVKDFESGLGELSKVLELPAMTIADLSALIAFAQILEAADEEVLSHRRPELSDASALSELRQTCDSLRAEKESLESEIDFSELPDTATVRSWAQTLSGKGMFSFLSGTYRSASKGWNGVLLPTTRGKDSDPADYARRLAKFCEERDAFDQSQMLHALAGSQAKGLRTDFVLLERVSEFLQRVDGQFLPYGVGKTLGATLASGDLKVLRLLRQRIVPQLNLEHVVDATSLQSDETSIADACETLSSHHQRVKEVAQLAQDAEGIDLSLTARDLAMIADQIDSLSRLSTEIETSPGAGLLPPGIASDASANLSSYWTTLESADRLTGLSPRIRELVFAHPEAIHEVASALGELADVWRVANRKFEKMSETASIGLSFWDGRESTTVPFSEQRARARSCSESPEDLDAFAEWLRNLRGATELGIREFVEAHFKTGMKAPDLYRSFCAVLRRAQVRDVLDEEDGLLKRLNGKSQEQARRDYSRLDKELITFSQVGLKHQLSEVRVPEGVPGPKAADRTECALIEHEYNKKTRYVPVRNLMRRARKTIAGTKPCFMMSPRSVSTYLPLGDFQFDLVVIDEASQMKPEFAIGALARAKQAVIVGDPLQLPPTDFFSRSSSDEDVDEEFEEDTVDQESVLDQALKVRSRVSIIQKVAEARTAG